jgi:TRAP-type C4-dicarboxylate transport system permease small subunit
MKEDDARPGMVGAILGALEAFLVVLLAAMVVMVFGNVVLRYGFNSGITISEEVSRFLFVWLTFLGAIPVMLQRGHLGVEFVVDALPGLGRRLCRILADLLMIGCCVVFGWGAWGQTQLNMTNYLPVSGMATGWIYGAAVVSAAGMGLLVLVDLVHTVLSPEPPEPSNGQGYEP